MILKFKALLFALKVVIRLAPINVRIHYNNYIIGAKSKLAQGEQVK